MKELRNLRWQLVAILLGFLAAMDGAQAAGYKGFAAVIVQDLPGGAEFRPDLERLLAGYANAYRAQQGKAPLIADDRFLAPARAHAADMMINNFLGHTASTGHNFDSRMRVYVDDITRYPNMAENAARESQNTPVNDAKVMRILQQWIHSPKHRKSLVSRDHAFVSTAVVQRGNKLWAVQIFWAKPRAKGLFQ